MKIQAVWYVDDNGMKHFTTVRERWELNFLKMRFLYVRVLTENEDFN